MNKFISVSSRTSWCMSRLLARSVVSHFAGTRGPPEFAVGHNGKPFLPGSKLDFNWSHTAGCVVLAVSERFDVGVDVESSERVVRDYADIARHYFNPDEALWVTDGPASEAWHRFLSLFVQKEAALKARGEGLSGSLSKARADKNLPPMQSSGSLLFRSGRDGPYFVAVRTLGRPVAGAPAQSVITSEPEFIVYREIFDAAAGVLPVREWTKIDCIL